MDYIKAIEYVHAIPKFVRPLGNLQLGGLLKLLGNPHEKLKFVHVAGTNGKGSVCSMTAEILKQAGYKTGLFTSPYIEVFNERIKINGNMIADDVLAGYVTDIAELSEKNDIQVSEFAFITAAALKYFADSECDVVVLETGMGGRLDATNIITDSVCSVITSVSLDHTQYLGDTLEEIALEKCGIIKPDGTLVAAPNDNIRSVIEAEVSKNNAVLVVCDTAEKTADGFRYKGIDYKLALRGGYQAENGAVVTEIVNVLRNKGFKISDTDLYKGLTNVQWHARYEFITPDIVIDGGHNMDGIRALKQSLLHEQRSVTLVMAMMSDKAYKECITDIVGIAQNVVATQLQIPRALEACQIKTICDDKGINCCIKADIAEAIQKAIDLSNGGLVCVCGSLYLAGEARKILKDKIGG